jgi:DNA polymerase-3 subunit delta'
MLFSQVPGLEQIKASLKHSVIQERLPQTQLFSQQDGGAGLALTFSLLRFLACENKNEDSCGACVSCKQLNSGNYPELHLVFPFAKTVSNDQKFESALDLTQTFLSSFQTNPYMTKYSWQQQLETGNKQFLIPVGEAERIGRIVQTKASAQKPRFFVIWLPELLNVQAANKLLKVLEEPALNTYFFLVSLAPDQILLTLKSRCSHVKIPRLSEKTIHDYLLKTGISKEAASSLALTADGNLGKAIEHSKQAIHDEQFARMFSTWMRLLYSKKLDDLLFFVDDTTKMNREEIKSFLLYTTSMLRIAFGFSISKKPIALTVSDFSLEKFSAFLKVEEMSDVEKALNSAKEDIARNGNPRIIILSVSLLLFKYIGQA